MRGVTMAVFGLWLMFMLYPGVCEEVIVDQPPVNIPELIHKMEGHERDWVQYRAPMTPTIHAVVSLIDIDTGQQNRADRDTASFTKGLEATGLVHGGALLGLEDPIPPMSYLVLVTWPVSKEHDGFIGYAIKVVFSDASGRPEEIFSLVHEEELELPKQIMEARVEIVRQLRGAAMYELLNHWENFRRSRYYFAWDYGEREEA
jgi:hypothetical protein